MGSLFFVNDFGVSYSSDPSLPICRRLSKNDKPVQKVKHAGHRPFIVVGGKLTPVRYNYSGGDSGMSPLKVLYKKVQYTCPPLYLPLGNIEADLTDEQISVTKDPNANSYGFYADSNTIPFFDSYVDTQDMIRTFIGGERVSQDGMHGGIATDLFSTMNKYQLKDRKLRNWINMDELKLAPSMLLAGYFIDTYFKEDMNMFLTKPDGGILLQKFVI